MKEYVVYSESSRGLGNVMNSDNQLEHMEGSNCSPILTDTIFNQDNLDLPVFEIKLNGEKAYVNVELIPAEGVAPNESLTLKATLKNSNDEFIDNVHVFFYENDMLLGSGETVAGVCEYEYSSDVRGEHIIVVKTNDELQYDATSTNVTVYVYYNTSIALNVSPDVIDVADTVVVNAALLRDDNVPISGGVVEIYNNDTLLNSSITDEQGGCLNYYNAHDLKRDYGSDLNFKAVFNKTVEYLPSQSSIVTKTVLLSEPSINLEYPSAQYNTGDTIPLTFYVTDKMGNLLEGIELVIDILDTQYTGVTDNNGQFVLNYIVSSSGDMVVEVSSVEDNYYSSKTISETVTVGKLNTVTSLTSSNSSSSISFIEDFTLSATVSSGDNQNINGTVSFYDDGKLLETVSLTGNVANYNYSTTEIKEHTFHAVFNETDEYNSSQSSNVIVNIIKDTPLITVLTSDIYSGWKVGAILKNSKGTVLANKSVVLSGATSGTLTTNIEGKVTKAFNGTAGSSYTITYEFNGDSEYESVSISKTFKILSPKTASKCPGTWDVAAETTSTRGWVDEHSNCEDNYARCTNIATASGSHKKPCLLSKVIKFSLPSGCTVTNLKADWKSKLVKYTSEYGYASIGAPTITISGDGSGSTHTKTAGTPGKNTYVSGTFNYSGATAAGLNDGVTVKAQFPANTSGEIGQIYFIGVKLTATYIPAQGAI